MTDELGTELLSRQRVVELHAAALEQSGGLTGKSDLGCVDGSVGNAVQAAMYESQRPDEDALLIAAYVCYYLAKNHCFSDGNKRVAWLACLEVLEVGLDVRVDASIDDAYEFMDGVATSRLQPTDIVGWLSERLVYAFEDEPIVDEVPAVEAGASPVR